MISEFSNRKYLARDIRDIINKQQKELNRQNKGLWKLKDND